MGWEKTMYRFTVTYDVSDGYAGTRMQNFRIDASKFEDCASEDEVKAVIDALVEEDIRIKIFPIPLPSSYETALKYWKQLKQEKNNEQPR